MERSDITRLAEELRVKIYAAEEGITKADLLNQLTGKRRKRQYFGRALKLLEENRLITVTKIRNENVGRPKDFIKAVPTTEYWKDLFQPVKNS